ncbi:Ig-like domain-containing protein [Xenophilus arseniciresistens]|uniref:Ig-like domain-containing protein n=1 Tax=Xenophilus arseniciresistens TaxID=1283306 RepID=A0AAE3N5V8_9BURK|nr:Ig-like domain-containing protein [Xenophilus arseniciresistens]MDA7416475.1 Ig-like domain-containing protein [Xenophilus arseniciresistens]
MKYLEGIGRASLMALVAAAVVACGGGGGSPSVPIIPIATNPTNPTNPATPTTPAAPTAAMAIVNVNGVSTSSMTTLEISQVRFTLLDAKGVPVQGKVVTFTESGSGLLSFAPSSGTALTDANGLATIEVRAASSTSTGATTVVGSALVDGTTVTAEKSLAISNAPSVGQTDPQALASSIGFLDINPADKSIVLAGSGGNGRAESATLRFRVVDANNTPVKGAKVSFSVNPAEYVTLNVPTATSDAEGVVLTTVSSQNVTTSAVVVAKVDGRNISSQSDQLLITTGVATQAGFDLSATKFNLDSATSGDKSTITVRIVDTAGNPVADGVPVVFTSDFLAVGSSSRGGCVTANGQCSVDLSVQDPRPLDGQYVIVTASTRVGANAEAISDTIQFTAPRIGDVNVYDAPSGGAVATTRFAGDCKVNVPLNLPLHVGTNASFPAPAQSTVTVISKNPGVTMTVQAGGTVLDQLAVPRQRTRLDLAANISEATCAAGSTAGFDVIVTSPNGNTVARALTLEWTPEAITPPPTP